MAKKNALLIDDYVPLTNNEIIEIYVKNGLIEECAGYQFSKCANERWKLQYSGDMVNDLILVMANYPNDKLNNIHQNNHMNAWLTRVLQNNLMSNSSKFYTQYLRFNLNTDEINWKSERDWKNEET